MKPSNIRWPFTFDGFSSNIYDFGNGYGALHIQGFTESPQTNDDVTTLVVVEKNELHPLTLPKFGAPQLNYYICPEIEVTADTLQTELARLKDITDGK